MHTYEELPYNHPKCLMDIYLRSKDLDFKDIIGISCDFLLAGMDTVSTAFTIFYYSYLSKKESFPSFFLYKGCKMILIFEATV